MDVHHRSGRQRHTQRPDVQRGPKDSETPWGGRSSWHPAGGNGQYFKLKGKDMPRTFYVVGEEITLDGECIGQIYTSLPAVLFQDICDTLEGIELYDQHNDGTLQQLEAIKDKEGVQANKRKGFLSIARKWLYRHRRDKWVLEQTLSAVNQHLTVALQERDQARQWAEGVALQLQETLRERDEARAFAESLLART